MIRIKPIAASTLTLIVAFANSFDEDLQSDVEVFNEVASNKCCYVLLVLQTEKK